MVAGLTMAPAFGGASGTRTPPTMTVGHRVGDTRLDGPDCVQAPRYVDFTIVGNIHGVVTGDLAYAGSSSKASEIEFCPAQFFSNKVPVLSTGTVTSPRANGVTSALAQSTAAVNRNPVRMLTPG